MITRKKVEEKRGKKKTQEKARVTMEEYSAVCCGCWNSGVLVSVVEKEKQKEKK